MSSFCLSSEGPLDQNMVAEKNTNVHCYGAALLARKYMPSSALEERHRNEAGPKAAEKAQRGHRFRPRVYSRRMVLPAAHPSTISNAAGGGRQVRCVKEQTNVAEGFPPLHARHSVEFALGRQAGENSR